MTARIRAQISTFLRDQAATKPRGPLPRGNAVRIHSCAVDACFSSRQRGRLVPRSLMRQTKETFAQNSTVPGNPARDESHPARLTASPPARARLPRFYATIDFEVSTFGAGRQDHFQ